MPDERPRGLRPEAAPPLPLMPARVDEAGEPDDTDDLGEVPRESLLSRIPGMMANAGKPFSKKESEELYEELVESFAAYCEALDYLITKTNRNRAECTVWQDLDDDDLGVFADLAIYRAQKSARVATAVRAVIAGRLYLQAGMISIDRFAESVSFYQQQGGLMLWFPNLGFPVPFRSSSAS